MKIVGSSGDKSQSNDAVQPHIERTDIIADKQIKERKEKEQKQVKST